MRRSKLLLVMLTLAAAGCDNPDPDPPDQDAGHDAGHDAPDPFDAGGVTESFTVDHIGAFKTVTIADTTELLRLPLRGKR